MESGRTPLSCRTRTVVRARATGRDACSWAWHQRPARKSRPWSCQDHRHRAARRHRSSRRRPHPTGAAAHAASTSGTVHCSAHHVGTTAPVENAIGSPQSASQGLITQFDLANQPLLRPGRDPGADSRPDRHAAQRHPQGEPVFPARLQPRPRHRLRRLRRRHALQPADPRPRPGLSRPELGHPRTGRARRFPQGAVLRRGRRLLLGRLGQHSLLDALPDGIVKIEAGKYDWFRARGRRFRRPVGSGTLLYAVEASITTGPTTIKEHCQRVNGDLPLSHGDRDRRLSAERVSATTTSGTRSNQIPAAGRLRRADCSTASSTRRLRSSHRATRSTPSGGTVRTTITSPGQRLRLLLFAQPVNNFTFFLQDPVHGDQNDQIDRRWVSGFNVSHQWSSLLFGEHGADTVGLQLRNDWHHRTSALHHTEARVADQRRDQTTTSTSSDRRLLRATDEVDARRSARSSACAATILRFNVDAHECLAENSGQRGRQDHQPEGVADAGPVGQDRVLPQRRLLVSQQRRAGVVEPDAADVDRRPDAQAVDRRTPLLVPCPAAAKSASAPRRSRT